MSTAAAPATYIRLDHDQVARVVNEALRAMCLLMYDVPPKNWADQNQVERRALSQIVAFIHAHPASTPEDYHELLVGEARQEGWQRGEYRDVIRKIHPLACAYHELPAKYRAKQGLVFAMVRHLLSQPG
jgi:hypothetical protein